MLLGMNLRRCAANYQCRRLRSAACFLCSLKITFYVAFGLADFLLETTEVPFQKSLFLELGHRLCPVQAQWSRERTFSDK